VRLIFIGI